MAEPSLSLETIPELLTIAADARQVNGGRRVLTPGSWKPRLASIPVTISDAFQAGAARLSVDPPLGLPMVGVVRRPETARSRLGKLEVSALALRLAGVQVILCGVDTLAIQAPEVDELRARISDATVTPEAGILLNWNHTHHAPPGGVTIHGSFGEANEKPGPEVFDYIAWLHERIVDVCRLAAQRLEPAWARWGLGFADVAVNRRERDDDGIVRDIGWNERGIVDLSVPVLQAVRPDGSAIATVVSFGCHTVTTGINFIGYSPDYPGPLRQVVRDATGGECVFLQGAGGNVMPRFAFDDDCLEPGRMGRRLAVEALHAIADRPGWPAQLIETSFGSGTVVRLFRWQSVEADPPELEAVERRVDFPLLPLPSLRAVEEARASAQRDIEQAVARGAGESELRVLRYHGLNWARRAEAEIASGTPRTTVTAPINAVRIGDGVIVTGPGEVFTEIGLAVKERSPADVTLYAGYTNGCVSYFPTESEYPRGGYEPLYGNKTYGLPAQVAPECDRILVQTGVELASALFPERIPPPPGDWKASGDAPSPLPDMVLRRPPRS
jgi:hypothetical protein